MSNLVLSLFPGIDLLGMGFEQAGFTVVRGPDPLFGGDIRTYHVPRGSVRGIIGGSPCQDFSRLRRVPPTGYGKEMIQHFQRIVAEAQPAWFVLENVPRVPDVMVPGYQVQRIHVRASEFGGAQHRLRIIQFGYRDSLPLTLPRLHDVPTATEAAATASEGRRVGRRSWAEFCALQGLTEPMELPDFTKAAKYKAVGNGVFVPMAKAIAIAILNRRFAFTPCDCGCARPVPGPNRRLATVACRKRAERQRKRDNPEAFGSSSVTGDGPGRAHQQGDTPAVTVPGHVTAARSPVHFRVGPCPCGVKACEYPHCPWSDPLSTERFGVNA